MDPNEDLSKEFSYTLMIVCVPKFGVDNEHLQLCSKKVEEAGFKSLRNPLSGLGRTQTQ